MSHIDSARGVGDEQAGGSPNLSGQRRRGAVAVEPRTTG